MRKSFFHDHMCVYILFGLFTLEEREPPRFCATSRGIPQDMKSVVREARTSLEYIPEPEHS